MIPVSIIIPSYNAESWISDTLQSAMAQSYPAIEIILVDDGSKDRTVSVAREKLQREFARSWKIIELEGNRGPSVARNLGLGVAGGDWIQFLDSDDLIAPDKLEREMAVCINCDPDVSAVYSPWRRYHAEAGEIIWEGPLAKPNMQGKPPIMCLVGGDRFLHGAGLSRRSTLNQIGGFNEALRFWECEEVNVRLAKVGRFEQVQSLAPLYMWRMHRESAYIGGEKARYQLAPVALSWISLLLEAAEHRPLSDLGTACQKTAWKFLTAAQFGHAGFFGAIETRSMNLLIWLKCWILTSYPQSHSIFHEYLGTSVTKKWRKLSGSERCQKKLFGGCFKNFICGQKIPYSNETTPFF